MANFKNVISSIFSTTLFLPNKATTVLSCKLDTCPNKGSRTMSSSPPPPPPEAAECAVCLSALNGEKAGTRVLTCRHEFHSVCVERWLDVPYFKNTCPICRFSIVEDDDRTRGGGDGPHSWKEEEDQWFTEEMVIWFSSFHVAGF